VVRGWLEINRVGNQVALDPENLLKGYPEIGKKRIGSNFLWWLFFGLSVLVAQGKHKLKLSNIRSLHIKENFRQSQDFPETMPCPRINTQDQQNAIEILEQEMRSLQIDN
jgi:hypothetical protein